jgi:S-ribosylhomocysteine lyase LuxS involved in autoinducer biosynthesis
LKESVYKNKLHTLEDLKQNIELCISNVTAESLHWVASNMRKKVNASLNVVDISNT